MTTSNAPAQALLSRPNKSPTRRSAARVRASKSPVKSLDFVTLRIKDAVCDRFRAEAGSRPSIDTREPDARVHAYLTYTLYELFLDTSGAALYQRGMRRASIEAPLREIRFGAGRKPSGEPAAEAVPAEVTELYQRLDRRARETLANS